MIFHVQLGYVAEYHHNRDKIKEMSNDYLVGEDDSASDSPVYSSEPNNITSDSASNSESYQRLSAIALKIENLSWLNTDRNGGTFMHQSNIIKFTLDFLEKYHDLTLDMRKLENIFIHIQFGAVSRNVQSVVCVETTIGFSKVFDMCRKKFLTKSPEDWQNINRETRTNPVDLEPKTQKNLFCHYLSQNGKWSLSKIAKRGI